MKNIILFFSLIIPVTVFSQRVENLRSEQKGNNIIIYYDLFDVDENDSVLIEVYLSIDNGLTYEQPLTSVSGDVGSGITSGTNKEIIWDVLKDINELNSNAVRFMVKAYIHKNKIFKHNITISGFEKDINHVKIDKGKKQGLFDKQVFKLYLSYEIDTLKTKRYMIGKVKILNANTNESIGLIKLKNYTTKDDIIDNGFLIGSKSLFFSTTLGYPYKHNYGFHLDTSYTVDTPYGYSGNIAYYLNNNNLIGLKYLGYRYKTIYKKDAFVYKEYHHCIFINYEHWFKTNKKINISVNTGIGGLLRRHQFSPAINIGTSLNFKIIKNSYLRLQLIDFLYDLDKNNLLIMCQLGYIQTISFF